MSNLQWAQCTLVWWRARCAAMAKDERGAIDNVVWVAGAAAIAAVAIAIILVKVRDASNAIDVSNPVPSGP